MSPKIHYEDNLFFLHSILRTAESGLRLDLDPELFRDKILEDLFFVGAVIMRTHSSLRENTNLIQRTTYLRSLRRTITAYINFLDHLLNGAEVLGGALEPYREKLRSARQDHIDVRREVDELLDREHPDDESESIISSQEYSFLLAQEAQEDDERLEDDPAGFAGSSGSGTGGNRPSGNDRSANDFPAASDAPTAPKE